jgi:hypothetical protein
MPRKGFQRLAGKAEHTPGSPQIRLFAGFLGLLLGFGHRHGLTGESVVLAISLAQTARHKRKSCQVLDGL